MRPRTPITGSCAWREHCCHTIRLTGRGTRALAHARRLTLVVQGTFTPSGQGGVIVLGTITLT
jgi:hypothetical protein